MAKYLANEEVLPILVPDLENPDLGAFLSHMDGFVFQGGTDIAPETYGETPHHSGKWHGDTYRDQYELRILDYAIKHAKPVLGICRGFQLINVYFGGTLLQDIDTFHHDSIRHRDAEMYDQLAHSVEFVNGKLLDQLHPDQSQNVVNSVHHQGVKALGKDLEVLAYCNEDSIIEALHWTGSEAGKVLGVQWHPEFFKHFDGELIDGEVIYHHFLDFCRSKAKSS